MSRLFKKRTQPLLFQPESSLHRELIEAGTIHLSVVEYTEKQFTEKNDISLEECLKYLNTPSMTWIQVYGVSDPSVIAAIGREFKIHPLVLEDIMHTTQRSKIDVFDNQIFIVARLLQINEANSELKDEQISLIFGKNYLISFLESKNQVFKSIKERLSLCGSRLRKQGADYLAYSLLDVVIDHYFFVLEKVDTHLDHLEEELINLPKPHTLYRVQQSKRDLIILRKSVWPLRDVINKFLHMENPLVSAYTQIYLQDIYDHIVQMIDIIEGFRDVVSGMFDIYLSNINIRTNEIVKVLTIVSTIFVPLTFISSLYGMNFDHMPELHTYWGYPIILAIMIVIAGGMLLFFRHKKWI